MSRSPWCWTGCAGWSTAATTRPGSPWSATDGLVTEKRAGKLVNLTDALEDDRLPATRTAIGHTRWATHGAPTDANAHPHLGGKDHKLALIHNGIIENYAAAQGRADRLRRRVRVRDRHRGRRAPGGRRVRRDGRPGRGDAPGLSPAGRRLHPAGRACRRARRRRRRPPQLPARGRGRRGRELPRLRCRGLHQPHARGDRARPGPGRRDHPGRDRHHRFRRRTRTGQGFSRRLGRRGRREGRLPVVHGQGDQRAAASRRRHPPRPHRRRGPADPGRAPDPGGAAAGDQPGRRDRLRHSVVRRFGREVRPRTLVPHPHRGRAGPRVPLQRPGRGRADARRRHLAVRRDDGHADGRAPCARARRARPGHLQHPRLLDPPRVRRRALHARRPGDRGGVDQGVPRPDHGVLPARPVSRVPARWVVRRGRRRGAAGPARDAGQDPAGARRAAAGPRDRALDGRHPLGALPRPARGVSGGPRGSAQAQGAGLHPRRGLRGRRAQTRPDRADRARPAGLRDRAEPLDASTACTPRSSRTSRRSARAEPAPWSSPRRATPTSRRTPMS